jgi:hypothetical protein
MRNDLSQWAERFLYTLEAPPQPMRMPMRAVTRR